MAVPYSDQKAAFFSRLCELSYLGGKSEEPWSEFVRDNCHYIGADSVSVVSEHGTQVAIVHFADMEVVVFRGTDEGSDWLVNLQYKPTETCGLFPGGTHRGFRDSARHVYNRVVADLDREKELYVTGHSKGGAEALLFAAAIEGNREKFVGNLPEVSGVYVYESPRVGNAKFIQWFNTKLGDRTFVTWNNNDIVPHIPSALPCGLRYLPRFFPWLKCLENLSILPLGYRTPEHVVYIDERGAVTHHPPITVILKGLWRGVVQKIRDADLHLFSDHDISTVARLLQEWADKQAGE